MPEGVGAALGMVKLAELERMAELVAKREALLEWGMGKVPLPKGALGVALGMGAAEEVSVSAASLLELLVCASLVLVGTEVTPLFWGC